MNNMCNNSCISSEHILVHVFFCLTYLYPPTYIFKTPN